MLLKGSLSGELHGHNLCPGDLYQVQPSPESLWIEVPRFRVMAKVLSLFFFHPHPETLGLDWYTFLREVSFSPPALALHQEPSRRHFLVQLLFYATLGLICPMRHICQPR